MPARDNSVASYAQQILTQVKTVVVGKDPVLLWVLAAILARGHILLEDIPGVGKTTMALAFSRVLSLSCSRVQFTPDVLPSDVTGYSVPDAAGEMRYQPGAVLCNLFLADELNRATSRTQSALLEAMEEGQVTVDGVSHPLPKPFTVIATQNPTGAAGTQLLPDSQMDRFMVRLSMGYPSPKDEAAMVLNRQGGNPLHELTPLMTREDLTAMQDTVEATYLSDSVVNYIVALISATRGSAVPGISARELCKPFGSNPGRHSFLVPEHPGKGGKRPAGGDRFLSGAGSCAPCVPGAENRVARNGDGGHGGDRRHPLPPGSGL